MLPVLIIAYKRLVEFEEVLNNLISQKATQIYIAIDGTKDLDPDLSDKFVLIINKFEKKYPHVTVEKWMRTRNLGSAVSVVTAIDWAFQNSTELAIIEDDLVLSGELLEYFAAHMKQINKSRLMISGTNIFQTDDHESGLRVSHFPVVWGWATNRDSWLTLRKGILEQNIQYPKGTPSKVRSYLETGRRRAQSGVIDAWDVPLAAFMYAHRYECLVPGTNLISNRGFGTNATHTSERCWPLDVPIYSLGEKRQEQVSIVTEDEFDNLMMKKLYRISIRHILTHRLYRISEGLLGQRKKTVTLSRRIESVEIPNLKSAD
jgi:hypothetical protein